MEAKKKKNNNVNKEVGPQIIYETKENLYAYAVKMMDRESLIVQFTYKIENFLEAARMFDELGEYKDSIHLAQRCRELAEKAKKDEAEYYYQLALEQKSKAKDKKGFDKASKIFKRVAGYKDADQLAEECIKKISGIKTKNRIKQIVKLGIILICVVLVIWFLNTPAWMTMQEKMIEINKVISTEMPN